jgi:hypothetical protein
VTATGAAVRPALDLFDADLRAVRARLSRALLTRSRAAMWACCQDLPVVLADLERLAVEVGRLRHDFTVVSEDLDQVLTDLAPAQPQRVAVNP